MDTGDSAGILVLGMHRSGTSVLARLLELCGANVGARVLGGSRGNDAGHWEDAFAVETSERLLAALGQRWDDVLPLPPDWEESEAAGKARSLVRGYLESDRCRHPLWVAKDPRLCLFGGIWCDAAAAAGNLPLTAVIVVRHPMEIARSLAVRDGMPPAHALLLWLKYMLEALAVAERIPAVVVSYEQMLGDWQSCLGRIAALPGAGALGQVDPATEAAVEAMLDRGRPGAGSKSLDRLPGVLADAWQALEACAGDGKVPAGLAGRLRAAIAPGIELAHALVGESRVEERKLWERVASAEAALADEATGIRRMPEEFQALRSSVETHRAEVVDVMSGEIRHMQESAAEAIRDAATQVARVGAEAALARDLAPRINTSTQLLGARIDASANVLDTRIDASTQALDTRMASLEQRLARVFSEKDALEHRHAELEATAAGLRAAVQDANERNAALDASNAALATHVDASRRSIAAQEAELHQLRDDAAQLASLRGSRSWRMTRPLRVMRRLLAGEWSDEDTAQWHLRWRRWRARLPGAPGDLPPAHALLHGAARVEALPVHDGDGHARLLPAVDGKADVFVWGVIDWHFRTQRPQHLAMALARQGHRVFYVSNNFVDDTSPGFKVEPLDASGRLFQVHLNLEQAPTIYHDMPDPPQQAALQRSLAELLAWTATEHGVSVVQHPYWGALAGAVPNVRVVYDCMDHHAGFDNNATSILAAEEALIADADLVIVTSSWLHDEVAARARSTALIRNAAEAGFFRQAPARVHGDPEGRKIIGYYGAIAPWFDVPLVRRVAEANPDAVVILVGSDTIGAGTQLSDLPNVRMTGEVPYADLPGWLHGFDVCLLPFQVLPLTLATNPVKVYEYLAAGKPVVAVDLPEMRQFGDLVDVAGDHQAFVDKVGQRLREGGGARAVAARQAFAAEQSWEHRAVELDAELSALDEPRVSVVVLAYNNLAFTRACLASIEAHSDYRNLEVIVVDNASSDGSADFLRDWEAEGSAAGHRRRLILNDTNLGFAAGNNVGLAAAEGEFLVVLNNDTYVTPGWVRTMRAHFRRDANLGLLGPVTNNIGNEAKIEIAYADMKQMVRVAGEYTRRHPGRSMRLPVAAFFCVMLPRAVYEAVGGLDEAFGVGFFEDDDYCRRVEQAGWEVGCAEDVFIHHHLSASFDALGSERKRELFERNKAIYESKWGAWEPHAYRPEA